RKRFRLNQQDAQTAAGTLDAGCTAARPASDDDKVVVVRRHLCSRENFSTAVIDPRGKLGGRELADAKLVHFQSESPSILRIDALGAGFERSEYEEVTRPSHRIAEAITPLGPIRDLQCRDQPQGGFGDLRRESQPFVQPQDTIAISVHPSQLFHGVDALQESWADFAFEGIARVI